MPLDSTYDRRIYGGYFSSLDADGLVTAIGLIARSNRALAFEVISLLLPDVTVRNAAALVDGKVILVTDAGGRCVYRVPTQAERELDRAAQSADEKAKEPEAPRDCG